jgi:hypothetical protein
MTDSEVFQERFSHSKDIMKTMAEMRGPNFDVNTILLRARIMDRATIDTEMSMKAHVRDDIEESAPVFDYADREGVNGEFPDTESTRPTCAYPGSVYTDSEYTESDYIDSDFTGTSY